MIGWSFPSRNNGEIEGFSNPALEWFKGNPLRALAREICQNSLDAQLDEENPVVIEFKKELISPNLFPGMNELEKIIKKCREFWENDGDEKTRNFIDRALSDINQNKICVLRISDFNTKGLEGPYNEKTISTWVSLVKGNAFSIKSSNNTAAGSFGIGKAAPFINSIYQTVFYRTKNIDGDIAAQGVAHLMSFIDDSYGDSDPIRRSVGYYGEMDGNLPIPEIKLLNRLYERDKTGTDLFLPGFDFTVSGRGEWINQMIGEILDSFLMSIENNNLCVKIEDQIINKKSLNYIVARNQKYAKDAYYFNKILISDNKETIIEEINDFHGMGYLRLRLLYANDLNKKILVVRKSGMKISEIRGLPKGISYTGILELNGEKLNSFFRDMENPTHDKWEPKRHSNPELAKQYRMEVEDWVKSIIRNKVEEMSGAEVLVDTGNLFNTSEKINNLNDITDSSETKEDIIDTTKSVEITMNPTKNKSVRSSGGNGESAHSGTIDDSSDLLGHRHRDGDKSSNPSGRKGKEDDDGIDNVYSGLRYVNVKARVISVGKGVNRLIFIPENSLSHGEVQVYATCENGKKLPLLIDSLIKGTNKAEVKNGKIILFGIEANEKIIVDFKITSNNKYALEVEVSGN